MIFTKHPSLGIIPVLLVTGVIFGILSWIIITLIYVNIYNPVVFMSSTSKISKIKTAEVDKEYVESFVKMFLDRWFRYSNYSYKNRRMEAAALMSSSIRPIVQSKTLDEYMYIEVLYKNQSMNIERLTTELIQPGVYEARALLKIKEDFAGISGDKPYEYNVVRLILSERYPDEQMAACLQIDVFELEQNDEVNKLNDSIKPVKLTRNSKRMTEFTPFKNQDPSVSINMPIIKGGIVTKTVAQQSEKK